MKASPVVGAFHQEFSQRARVEDGEKREEKGKRREKGQRREEVEAESPDCNTTCRTTDHC